MQPDRSDLFPIEGRTGDDLGRFVGEWIHAPRRPRQRVWRITVRWTEEQKALVFLVATIFFCWIVTQLRLSGGGI